MINRETVAHVGLRNLKTALAVFICLVLYRIFERPYVIFACVSAIISMQDTVENSLVFGKNRLVGTAIGGFCGIIFLSLDEMVYHRSFTILFATLGIIVVIYLCNLFYGQQSTAVACIVFSSIMITVLDDSPIVYSMNRMVDTAVGVVIAVVINKYVNRRNRNNDVNAT